MALRGHPSHGTRKRKAPTVTLGRCELCDVDFTSTTQKESHLKGKKHSKNVRLVDAGQPPKKRQKTNYFSSFNKNMNQQPPPPRAMTMENGLNGYFVKSNDNGGTERMQGDVKPHERLQREVERIYSEYTQTAKSAHPLKAQQIYQKYQETYDQYIREYNLFADKFKKQQPIKQEEEEGKEKEKEKERKKEEEDEDDDLKPMMMKKSGSVEADNHNH